MGRVRGAGLASPPPVGKFEHRKKKHNRQLGDTLLSGAPFVATHIRRLWVYQLAQSFWKGQTHEGQKTSVSFPQLSLLPRINLEPETKNVETRYVLQCFIYNSEKSETTYVTNNREMINYGTTTMK